MKPARETCCNCARERREPQRSLLLKTSFSRIESRVEHVRYLNGVGKCAWVLALLASLAVPPICSAQQQGNVILDANEQLFCVLAAINAAGYDAGLGGSTGNTPRNEVRAYLAK